MPEGLIGVESVRGQALLDEADARADYDALTHAFEPQSLASFCGVASGVTVLNAMGRGVSQESFFNHATDAVRTRFQVMFGGMALGELAGLLEAHGVEVALHHAESTTAEEFRAALERNLRQEGDYLVVNYQREVLGQPKVGHISPVGAYDRESDRVLILDTAGHRYPPTWVPVEVLFAAMKTVDPSSGNTRGFVEVAGLARPSEDPEAQEAP